MQAVAQAKAKVVEPLHVTIARSYVGWKELKGNRGTVADSANRFTGSPLGSSYCHNFVLFMLSKTNAKTKLPRNGMAQSARTAESFSAISVIYRKNKVRIGDILTWSRFKGKRNTGKGHSGMASEDWQHTSGKSIQANTSGIGEDANGNGIYEKTARISPNSPMRITRITPIRY